MQTLGIEFLVRNPAYHATCLHFKCQVRTLSENKFKFHNVFFKVVHSVRHFFFSCVNISRGCLQVAASTYRAFERV